MVYTARLNEDEQKQNLALVLSWLLLPNECDPPFVSNQSHCSEEVLFFIPKGTGALRDINLHPLQKGRLRRRLINQVNKRKNIETIATATLHEFAAG